MIEQQTNQAALWSWHNLQFDFFRSHSSSESYFRWDLGICCNLEAKFFQHASQHQLYFHLCKPHPDAVARTMAKWHESIGVTCLFGLRGKPIWIKPLRIWPKPGIPVDTIGWYHYWNTLWHFQAFQHAVLSTQTDIKWSFKESQKKLLIKIANKLWMVIVQR